MEKELSDITTNLIVHDFGLEVGAEPVTEEDLFKILADSVAYMIEYRIDFLLSLLYRLDVDEAKINHALSPVAVLPANIGLAQLILDRQKQRIDTKKKYKSAPSSDLDGLEF